jgi:hypothetical protein
MRGGRVGAEGAAANMPVGHKIRGFHAQPSAA